MCNCTKQTKLLEFHIFNFCGLTLLATQETTREAKVLQQEKQKAASIVVS